MELNKIVYQCDMFYKLAGLFEAPPNMVNKLVKRAQTVYAAAVLHAVSLQPTSPQLLELKNEAQKYAAAPLSPPNEMTFEINMDLGNWKYISAPELQEIVKQWTTGGAFRETLTCVFSFIPLPGNKEGLYKLYGKILYVYLGHTNISSINEFRHYLNLINLVIRHELQHYGQEILSFIIKYKYDTNKELAGLPPSKYRDKKHDIEGIPLEFANKKIRKDIDLRSDHELRDREFYTNLSDSVERFKSIVPAVIFKTDFAKAWVGLPNNLLDNYTKLINEGKVSENRKKELLIKVNDWNRTRLPFKILQQKDENKWKLAVKIFWKEISSLL